MIVDRASATETSDVVSADRRVMAVILFGPSLGMLNALALVPFLAIVAGELGTSIGTLGQVTALTMAAATGLGLIAGPIADRYGYRPTLLLGIVAVMISAVGSALAPNYAMLLVAALVGAISRAVLAPVSLTIAADWFVGDTRRRAIGLVSASVAGAAVVGVPLLTSVAAVGGWRGAFVALALLAMVVGALAYWALPARRSPSSSSLRVGHVVAAYLPLLRDRAMLGLIGSTFMRSAGAWALGTYIAAFLVLVHGMSLQEASLAFAAAGAGIFAGSVVGGERLGAVPLRPLVMGCSALNGCILGTTLMLPVEPIAVIGLTFAGFLLNGVGTVAANTLLADESRAGQATTMGLNGAALSLSSAVGGSVGGLVLALGGYQAIGVVVLMFGLASAVLVWLTRPPAATPGRQIGRRSSRSESTRVEVQTITAAAKWRAAAPSVPGHPLSTIAISAATMFSTGGAVP